MAYWDGHLLAIDEDFKARVEFCAIQEGATFGWVVDNTIRVAAAPGLADAYASALAGGVEDPGRDPAVISDAMILAAVQGLLVG